MTEWVRFESGTRYDTRYRRSGREMDILGVWTSQCWDTYEQARLDPEVSEILSTPYDFESILPAGFKALEQVVIRPVRSIELRLGKFTNTLKWMKTSRIQGMALAVIPDSHPVNP